MRLGRCGIFGYWSGICQVGIELGECQVSDSNGLQKMEEDGVIDDIESCTEEELEENDDEVSRY